MRPEECAFMIAFDEIESWLINSVSRHYILQSACQIPPAISAL
jgi:hypothetical protein